MRERKVSSDAVNPSDPSDPADPAEAAGKPQRSFQRGRLRLGLLIAVVCGSLVYLVFQGLGNATTYFRNADEALADRSELGTHRFRLQGTVMNKPSQQGDSTVFTVVYHCAEVKVSHRGDPPELFRQGIPVVLEGSFSKGDDEFHSDLIRVRHTSEYRTKGADRIELAEKEACP